MVIDIDQERLVRAILVASEEGFERRPDSRFEWYASADEMAEAILAALTEYEAE